MYKIRTVDYFSGHWVSNGYVDFVRTHRQRHVYRPSTASRHRLCQVVNKMTRERNARLTVRPNGWLLVALMNNHPDHAPNGYTFKSGGNRVVYSGKSHWRDCLTVILDRHRAFDLLVRLATALQRGEREIQISDCGWLEQDEVGSWPFKEKQYG